MELITKQLSELGLTPEAAESLVTELENNLKTMSAAQVWQKLTSDSKFLPNHFDIYDLLYKTIYPNWDELPEPAWFPENKIINNANLTRLMKSQQIQTYEEFQSWSASQFTDFWELIVNELNLIFDKNYSEIVDLRLGVENPKWFPDARLNIINSCFQADENAIAIISQTENGSLTKITYLELNQFSNRIANSLKQKLQKNDRVAIIMPMTYYAVAIYLAIIKNGCTVVAIPDSFSPEEIAMRLRIAQVKMVFCQDEIIRDGKRLPFYEKIIKANPPTTIVIPVEKNILLTLRAEDSSWDNFLVTDDQFINISCEPTDFINILFSSGTTGEPKAIPWDHTSPIKCGSDALLHHNLKAGDRFCWPTNLGWMMGPWLIFACLLNKATIALFEGSPNGESFGKFIQDQQVNLLGVVPTIVKNWRNTQCMEKLDWSSIKLFTSTGERSNTEDMLYLMALAHFRPIIEYCGGTEIAGGYITGTVIQPCAPGAFTTKACGLDFVILDDQGHSTNSGEVGLIPPSIGFSISLLNKNHHEVYYESMPKFKGKILRRHGDQVIQYPNGYYRLLGRVDDTMKLGGIKISSAEIETVLNTLPNIFETAAIAISPLDGGPSQLIVYAVLKTQDTTLSIEHLKTEMQSLIKQRLNPLFKIHEVIIIDLMPRTASNKIMRRILRDEYQKNQA